MKYHYQSVDNRVPSIRLLTLNGLDPNGEPTLSLQSFPLNQVDNKFNALSYTWGDDVPIKRIWIDGAWMLIRDHLWDFLQHCAEILFPKMGQVRLWIDAICINQEDIHEKNIQVRMMGDIYTSATEVLVWLGSASKRTAFAKDWKEFWEYCPDICEGDYFKKLESQSNPQDLYSQYRDIVDDV